MVQGNSFKNLTDLHLHLGSSSSPHFLWELAHQQGIRLPTKEYYEFYKMMTIERSHVSWEDFHELFKWTELIQSSPLAIERSVYETISGAYRVNNITLLELSFNPMSRNRGGEQDLDQIILAALRGMERALVEFPKVRAGLIFFLDRRFSYEQNEIIVKKAIKYNRRGVIGIDIAGPHKEGFFYKDYANLYKEARESGLKTTVHTGEDGTVEEMAHVISVLPLDRVNHGIRCYESVDLMKEIVQKDLTLCICPTSNLKIGFVKDIQEYGLIIKKLLEHNVKFCINTDGPAMFNTNIAKELQLMIDHSILTESELNQTMQWAREASFINLPAKNENLYL
ncbi:MAG TPA: hypothetical protein VK338_00910 [Candidatus Nitrosocosmicus sp.]|nr:hypothetical protein [Candidatus Nitrosocosmicus sp.]